MLLLTNILCIFIYTIILQALALHLAMSNCDDDSYVAPAAAAGGFYRDNDSYVAPAAAAGGFTRDNDSYVAPAAVSGGFSYPDFEATNFALALLVIAIA